MPNVMADRLSQIDFFKNLRREDLKAIARVVKTKHYKAGDVVCRQGREGHSLYIVQSGELRVMMVDRNGIDREIKRLKPGDTFGQTSLLLGEPRDATIEAVQDSTLLSLHRDDFEPLLRENPQIVRGLQMRPIVQHKYHARGISFKWLEPDERVLVSSHRHDALLLNNLIVPALAVLIILVGTLYWATVADSFLPAIVGVALCLTILVFIIYLALDHRDDIYIVTNKRVVRRMHTPFGKESQTDAPLQAIQDIQESQVGLLAQLYNFGDLIIETAGEKQHVAFREIPDPDGVREIIFEQINRLQSQAKLRERDTIRGDMQRYLETQTPPEAPPAPQPTGRPARPERGLITLLTRPFTYFLPPLRHVQGDTITWRKHWIALFKPILPPTLLGLVATALAAYFLFRSPGDAAAILALYSPVAIGALAWWLWRFDDWQNDIYQVTSTRIIDVERLPFFLREQRREATLDKIQNINYEIPGPLAKFLNYGSVTIETAGAGAFTFDRVKDPASVKAEIFRRQEAFRKRQQQLVTDRHRTELLDWFAVYDQMRRSGNSSAP